MTEALKCGRPLSDVNIVSPLELNGGLPVNLQDQTSDPIGIPFIKATVFPFPTLTEPVAVGAKTISVSSATGFAAGQIVLLTNPAHYMVARQIGAAAGLDINIDTPVDKPFSAGDRVVPALFNMNVNGAVTPQIFQVGPIGTTSTLSIDVTRLVGYIQDGGPTLMDATLFGCGPALTNGIVLRKKLNGTYINYWNCKTNGELDIVAAGALDYSAKAPAGSYGADFKIQYSGQNERGVVIRLKPTEILELIIQDDLTFLERFIMYAQGHFVTE